MKRTILAFVCAISGLSIIFTAVLIHFAVHWEFSQWMRRDFAVESGYIGAAVERMGEPYLRAIPRGEFAPRITLISKDGSVLYDSEGDADRMTNHLDRLEVASALERGVGEDTRLSETMREQTHYYATRLSDGNILRIARTTSSVFVSAAWLALRTFAIAVVVFAVAAWAGSRVTRKIVAPINRLDLEKPEDNVVYEELSPLLARMKIQNDLISRQMDETRKRQLEFSAIADNMREGLLILDQEGRVISCNQSALSLLRAKSGLRENQNILAFRREEAFRRAVEAALGGEPSEITFPVEGSVLQLMANPVTDDGAIRGAVVMLLDVTERENREFLRREFSANVSHELKTPLTAISGYAEIITNGVAKPEDAPRFAANIYSEAQRMIELIDDVMMLSKLDGNDVERSKERVELSSLVRGVIERMRAAASARDISVAFEGEDAEVLGIRQVLSEMVFNLLDNAVKYNIDGGRIMASVKRTGGEISLTVSDTGIGIPTEEQERVFERFYRVEKSRNGAVEGTGLGLSIVRHGAMLHGAKIDVQSDGKSGTAIVLRLPAAG
jgi:two-component system phosphate regulon sensor histidine kinase PhoR